MKIFDSNNLLTKYFEFKFSESIYCTSYFVYKFILYILGFIGFSVINNLILFLLFFVRIKRNDSNFLYKVFLIIASLVILYTDSFLPGLDQILSQLEGTSFNYKLDLLYDLINKNYILGFAGIYFICFLITDYLHGYAFVSVVFCIITFNAFSPYFIEKKITEYNLPNNLPQSTDIPPQIGDATNENIESYLKTFLEKEKDRLTSFPEALPENFEPFDILIVNICSMATDDIQAVKQDKHKVFEKFDLRFDNFNSVSSYSTPATMRLLRANCGQETESDMYSRARSECSLLNSLSQLGYQTKVFFDHNGVYGDYLKTLGELGELPQKLYPLSSLNIRYNSFDGSPIYSDESVFRAYIEEAKKASGLTLGFMNLISLHDGNRLPGMNKAESYGPRLLRMLNDLDYLVEGLKKSGRKTMLVVIPEHGAAIRGDKMQIARLREIPTSKITRIPTMIKFFGLNENTSLPEQITVHGSYSYLALSEIIKRAVENNIFSSGHETATVEEIATDLPQQAYISESTNAFYMNFAGKDFYKLKGDEWSEYKN
ncbi:cellulose biosynthesis protein BcsG [Succinivibrio dextrinosolvens]|uniref:cellulose biosynthesis protein BcsG n=1 Tax=Succinivibrio dextrinosolvens TaxID=83771 RepID=UPI0004E11197|nr:cellulose biosynthesis protein BcsG [Succinivibrio dextrinosolvens]MBE6422640.1 cellulose biosynthesis protein BcsG [Succinivibrio dextrinosolvens]